MLFVATTSHCFFARDDTSPSLPPSECDASQATEGSHFKTEQEEQLKEYRRRRIKEGKLKPDIVLPHSPEDIDNHVVGGHGPTVEKLSEIYAQEARLAAPHDVVRL